MYQPELGRWMAIDPLAGKYFSLSPYNYTANIPTVLIDPNGKEIDWSGVSRQDKRVIKRGLREHNSSSTYRNLYRELKKSDIRYKIVAEHDEGTMDRSPSSASFDANTSTKVETENESTGEKGSYEIQNPATKDHFKPGEKGGVLTINLALTGNAPSAIADLAVEEVVHAAQYDNTVKTGGAMQGRANTEFEAKAIVGQIQSESRNKIPLWSNSNDNGANAFGVQAFQTRSINGYFEALKQWHTNPRLDRIYQNALRTDTQPSLLLKLIK
jgi:uncharacterized protein RhaS with RHS repeats